MADVDVRTLESLIVQQFKNKPRLAALVRELLALIQGEFVTVLYSLERQMNLDTAVGAWLDHLGTRVGMTRPSVPDVGISYFGFDEAGVGFDQAPLRSVLPALATLLPMDDALYRLLLKAKVGAGAQMSAADWERGISNAGLTGRVTDNQDMTARILLATQRPDVEHWQRVFRAPSGVTLEVLLVYASMLTFYGRWRRALGANDRFGWLSGGAATRRESLDGSISTGSNAVLTWFRAPIDGTYRISTELGGGGDLGTFVDYWYAPFAAATLTPPPPRFGGDGRTQVPAATHGGAGRATGDNRRFRDAGGEIYADVELSRNEYVWATFLTTGAGTRTFLRHSLAAL